MQCSASKLRALLSASLVLVLALVPQPAVSGKEAPRDTTTTVEAVAPVAGTPQTPATPDVPTTARKRIIIGGSGVRIDDEGVTFTDSASSLDIDVDLGQNIDFDEDIVRWGESVFVASDEVVAGDIVVFGGNAIIEGTVAGTVVVLGGEIRARRGAQIRGDIVAIGGSIEEDEEVVIRGEKILIGGVAGAIGDHLDMGARTVRAVLSAVIIFVGFILFVITMLFLRSRVERVSQHVSTGLLKCFGAGLLTSVAGAFGLLIVMIPLIITIIGIPLAVILAVSCLGIYVIACTTFVYTVGRVFARRAGIDVGVFPRLLIGLALMSVPEIIAFVLDGIGHGTMPAYVLMKVLGIFLWLFAYVVGLGAIVVSRFGSRSVGSEPPSPRMVGEPAGIPAA